MGGFGSGRTRYAATPDDRDCIKLDVDDFTDVLNCDAERATGSSHWTRGGEETAKISWRAELENDPEQFWVKYTTTTDTEQREHEYPITIARTECNFGGSRPWWRCPDCGDRVGKLYIPPGRLTFGCRDCREFGYTSSRASGNTDRTLRMRYNRIRKKLGAEPAHPNSLDARTPDRPKGMHEDTYEELLDDLERARDRWHEEYFLEGLRKYAPDDFGVS